MISRRNRMGEKGDRRNGKQTLVYSVALIQQFADALLGSKMLLLKF